MTTELKLMPDHEHDWRFAALLLQDRKHKITDMPMKRPSVLLVCGCGEQRHDWVIAPAEDTESRPLS